MRTVKTKIERKVYIYAEAKTAHEIENLGPNELPFTYSVKSYDYGDESSVRIMEIPVFITIPEGIDITMECIKNLEEKIIAVQAAAKKEVEELRKRISALARLEYHPVEEAS